jgi:hypothetical protein
MADPFGRPVDPDAPDRDPVDERLRGLARDTESLVVLAGPAAARRRGERRSARRRNAALSAVVALALAVGSWQLLPRLGADPPADPASRGVSPAVPPKSLTAKLTDELLPASALPMYPKWPWQAVPDGSAEKIRGLCPVARPSAATASATRAYVTNTGQSAVYELYAFADPDHAYVAMQLMAETLEAKCQLVLSSDNDPKDPTGPGSYRGERPGATMETWLNRQDAYLGVLLLFGPGNLPGEKSDLVYGAEGPQQCIARSLNRLATGTSPSDPTATATPTTLPGTTLTPPGPPGSSEAPDSFDSGSSGSLTPSPSRC